MVIVKSEFSLVVIERSNEVNKRCTSVYQLKRLRRVTDMAALGYRYGCVGLQIWLRWVKDSTASG